MNIRKNDTVVILAGKDRGKRGRIFRIDPSHGIAYVEGANIQKRHMRPRPNVRQAGIIEREAPIHLSNLKLVCPSCGKLTKAKIERKAEGTDKVKIRQCKVCQATID